MFLVVLPPVRRASSAWYKYPFRIDCFSKPTSIMSAISDAVLTQILNQLQSLQVSQQTLQAKVCVDVKLMPSTLSFDLIRCFQLDSLTLSANGGVVASPPQSPPRDVIPIPGQSQGDTPSGSTPPSSFTTASALSAMAAPSNDADKPISDKEREKILYPGRVLLTSK